MAVHQSNVEWADRCPVRDVLERIGDRWSMLVLLLLSGQPVMRFSVLKNTIGDISQRMLSQTLRRLEQDGLISRAAHPTVPPRVEYALTPLGQSFLLPLGQLKNWAVQNHQQVREARETYVPPPKHDAL